MIFVQGRDVPALFLMLTDQDINNMRGGRTVFVDQRQLQGHTFDRVIVSLHRDNEEALQMIRRSGHSVPASPVEPAPRRPVEGRCTGCQGIMDECLLLDGKCAMCWREMALLYRGRIEATKAAP